MDKKFRIVSEGRGDNTQVFDPDGNEITDKVRSISWSIGAGNVAKVTLKLLPTAVVVDVQGERAPAPSMDIRPAHFWPG